MSRSFVSTKTCSNCGHVNRDIVPGVQERDCPCCGARHLRDVNAAVNIRNEGRRVFLEYFAARIKEEVAAVKKAEALSEGRRRKKSA